MKSKIYFIHKIGVIFYLLSILFTGSASSGNFYLSSSSNVYPFLEDPHALKIAVISDIHFLDPNLVDKSDALLAYEKATGRNIDDLHAVLDVVIEDIRKENPDFLLISGDITNHGEKLSHLGMIEKLRILQDQGIRILVIPGNHDINIPNAKAYRNDKPSPVESISKEDFAYLYAPFGYDDALCRDATSLSYLAKMNDSVYLLSFDTNRYAEHTSNSVTSGRILPETMDWALAILKETKDKGIIVLGMMHHGLVEHMPYQTAFFPQYLINEWEKNADLLADAGLKVVFTGHFHANDITLRTSAAGNTIYDVETASLAQYPFAYRIMELRDDSLSIDTRFITSVQRNPALAVEYRDKLEALTRQTAKNRLLGLGLPIEQETLEAITELMVKLNLMHVKGDEKPDQEMKMLIRLFADQLGSEADPDSFPFDFPPEDNRVVIPVGR